MLCALTTTTVSSAAYVVGAVTLIVLEPVSSLSSSAAQLWMDEEGLTYASTSAYTLGLLRVHRWMELPRCWLFIVIGVIPDEGRRRRRRR